MFSLDLGELVLRLLTWVPVFVLAICIHEATHAWAAWRLGDPTGVVQGRLTLDPRAHIDPMGALMFLFAMLSGFGFGWAKPVPVNPMNFRHPNRDIALVAAAGPASNVLQAFFWTAVLAFVASLMNILPFPLNRLFAPFVKFLVSLCIAGILINLGLAVFNLIPLPPLDGSRILRLFLPSDWRWRMDYLEATGMGVIVLLMLLWVGYLFPPLDVLEFVWRPVHLLGIWLIGLAT